jgi:hypothetical protein
VREEDFSLQKMSAVMSQSYPPPVN